MKTKNKIEEQNSTTQNNRLIAKFMGLPTETFNSGILNYGFDEGWYELEELSFHTDWNWLMPVVDKIESLVFDETNSFNVTIGATSYCVIQDSNGECYDMAYDGQRTKLLCVYQAVVEFIKWYNSTNKN